MRASRCAGVWSQPDHELRQEVSLIMLFRTNENNMGGDGIFLRGCDTKDGRQSYKSEKNPHTASAKP